MNFLLFLNKINEKSKILRNQKYTNAIIINQLKRLFELYSWIIK